MSADHFSQLFEALAEPFSSVDVEWKPGALNHEKTKALALAYVESRAYIQRLNALAGGDWSDEYQVYHLNDRIAVICRLTISSTTRTGDGECLIASTNGNGEYVEANAVTTASAQAFKRACVKFGLGLYLYNLPQKWCDYDTKSRRIIASPELPKWALPFAEREDDHPVPRPTVQAAPQPVQQNGNGNGTKPSVPSGNGHGNGAKPGVPSIVLPNEDPGGFVVSFGRNRGKTLAQIWATGKEGIGWVKWAAGTMEVKTQQDETLQKTARAYLLLQGLNPPDPQPEQSAQPAEIPF